MAHQFRKHYTRDEARALLPHLRLWLKRVVQLRDELARCEAKLKDLMATGSDLGGPAVNRFVHTRADMQDVLQEFYRRDVLIKDLDRGLVDFPAILNGKEVFLCWEECEDDIEFWHDLDSGYAGREPL
jgi:hypothetical protein